MQHMGWECPKCHFIYSPHIERCPGCIPVNKIDSVPFDDAQMLRDLAEEVRRANGTLSPRVSYGTAIRQDYGQGAQQ